VHDAALDLRDGLLGDDDDVARLEPSGTATGVGEEPSEVVSLLELGEAGEADHTNVCGHVSERR
jgi:hypothetical protein